LRLSLRPRSGRALVDLNLETVGTDLASGRYYLTSERVVFASGHTNRSSLGFRGATGVQPYLSKLKTSHYWPRKCIALIVFQRATESEDAMNFARLIVIAAF
jgi:hypothetical protein